MFWRTYIVHIFHIHIEPNGQIDLTYVLQALDILHQTRNFHASPEHHIKECYLQLAEVYLDVPSSDIRSWRQVSDEDVKQAEFCLKKATQMIGKDFYGRGWSKMKLMEAKLLIRKGELLEAVKMLEMGKKFAQISKASVDAQYCDELLHSIKASSEYKLQDMKGLSLVDHHEQTESNGNDTYLDGDGDDDTDDDNDNENDNTIWTPCFVVDG